MPEWVVGKKGGKGLNIDHAKNIIEYAKHMFGVEMDAQLSSCMEIGEDKIEFGANGPEFVSFGNKSAVQLLLWVYYEKE